MKSCFMQSRDPQTLFSDNLLAKKFLDLSGADDLPQIAVPSSELPPPNAGQTDKGAKSSQRLFIEDALRCLYRLNAEAI